MTYRRLTRVLHVTLLLAGIFALTATGLFLLKLRSDTSTVLLKLQHTIENANRTIIIAGAGLREIRLSEEAQIKQFTDTQQQITSTIEDLRQSIIQTNRNMNENLLPSVTMTVRGLNDSIQDFRGQTSRVMDDAHQNLLLLGNTQKRLDQTIASLDISGLRDDTGKILAHTEATSAHVDKITADAEYVANDLKARYVQSRKPKPWWKKYPETAAKAALFGLTLWQPW